MNKTDSLILIMIQLKCLELRTKGIKTDLVDVLESYAFDISNTRSSDIEDIIRKYQIGEKDNG